MRVTRSTAWLAGLTLALALTLTGAFAQEQPAPPQRTGPEAAPALPPRLRAQVTEVQRAIAKIDPYAVDAADQYRERLQQLTRLLGQVAVASDDLQARLTDSRARQAKAVQSQQKALGLLATRDQEIISLRGRLKSQTAKLDRERQTKNDVNRRLADAETFADAVLDQLAHESREITQLQTDLRVERKRGQTLSTDLKRQTQLAQDNQAALVQVRKQLGQATGGAVGANKRLAAAGRFNDELLTLLLAQDQVFGAALTDLEIEQKTSGRLRLQIADLKANAPDPDKLAAPIRKKLTAAEASAKGLRNQLAASEGRATALQRELKSQRARTTASQKLAADLQRQLAEQRAKATNDKKTAALEQQLRTQQAKAADSEKTAAALRKQVTDLTKGAGTAAKTVVRLRKELDQSHQVTAPLKRDLTTANQTVDALLNDLLDQDRELQALLTAAAKPNAEIKAMRERLAKETARADANAKQAAALKQQVTDLTTSGGSAAKTVVRLRKELDQSHQETAPLKRDLTTANETVDALLNDLLDQDRELQALLTAAAKPNAEIKAMRERLTKETARAEAGAKEIAALKRQLAQAAPAAKLRPSDKKPGTVTDLEKRLRQAELLAGLVPLEGRGLIITLRDSPRKPPPGADKRNFQVHEQDVNGVLTALKIAGAEALAIGDAANAALIRVTATTAARQVQGGILVGGRRLKAPYRIHVIGDRVALRAEMMRPGGVVKNAGLDVLQMVVIQSSNRVVVPAAKAGNPFVVARALGAGNPPATVYTPPAPTATPRPARTAPNPAARPRPILALTNGPRFAGKDLPRYHRPGCRFGERITMEARVQFARPAAAEAKGKRPCLYCRPESPVASAKPVE